MLGLLHKNAVRRGELEKFWEKATALGSASIGKALFNESVLLLVRREIRRDTGLLIDPEDLARSLHEMLSPEAREQIGPMRVRRRRRAPRKPTTAKPTSTVEAAAAPASAQVTPPIRSPAPADTTGSSLADPSQKDGS